MGHPMKQGEFVQPHSINSMSIQVAPGIPSRIQRPFEKPAMEFQVMKKQGNFPQAHHPPGMAYVNRRTHEGIQVKEKEEEKENEEEVWGKR
eukprot:UN00265